MKREFLASMGIGEDDIKKIMDENGKDIEREKRGVENLKNQIADLEANKTASDEALAALQLKAKGNEDLEQALADEIQKRELAQKEADDAKAKYEADMLERDRNDAISELVKSYGPRNEKAALSYLDQDKITYDPNTRTVSGAKEQLDALKESDGYLFSEPGKVNLKGVKPGEAGDKIDETKSPATLSDAIKQHYEKGESK